MAKETFWGKRRKAGELIVKAINTAQECTHEVPKNNIGAYNYHKKLTANQINEGIAAFMLMNNMMAGSAGAGEGGQVDLYALLNSYLLNLDKRDRINEIILGSSFVKSGNIPVRVNWSKRRGAANNIHVAHNILNISESCRYDSMIDYDDFDDIRSAENTICEKGYTKYKRCKHCWDGKLIELNCPE